MSFPGYQRILGPETLSFGDRLVRTVHEYRIWQVAIVTRRGGRVWETKTVATAYINAGRWIADCAYCHKGMLTRPDWRIACCGECGAFYAHVTFPPADVLAVVVPLLLARPNRDTQNWANPNLTLPIQSPADLERENREELQLC